MSCDGTSGAVKRESDTPRRESSAVRISAQRRKNLLNFLTTELNVLSYRGFFAGLFTAYPAIVPRTPEFYESLLQDDTMAGYAVQLIHEVAKTGGDIVRVIATPALARRLLQIASMPALTSFFSLLAIVKKFACKTEINEVVQEFEPAFASVVGLRDCRFPEHGAHRRFFGFADIDDVRSRAS
jgi:hypothetical protein